MTMMKAIFTIALTLAITITLTHHITKPVQVQEVKEVRDEYHNSFMGHAVTPKVRVSRFLAEDKNPRAADHCNKDGEVCAATNTTCCNNKCVNLKDLKTDKNNCGACKKKCKFTDSCCKGECVKLAYDKRNCGVCGNKCMTGGYCIYGLCNYA